MKNILMFSQEKKHLFYVSIIFLISILVNQFYGHIGVSPDSFAVFNGGFNILNNKLPFKDYWTLHGPLLDLIQSIFFKLFGISWFSYTLHASIFNLIISVATYLTLLKFKLKPFYSFFYTILLSILFFPTVGTPNPDHHSLTFALLGLFSFVLAIKTKKEVYWFAIPFFLILGFFSKQTPVSYVAILITFFTTYYFILNFKKKNIFLIFYSVIASSFLILFFIIILFKINNIDFDDFYNQYIVFASSVGSGRLNAEFLVPVEFNRYVLRFKLLHLSQIILIVVLIKNLHSNKNFVKKDDFIILSILISVVFILIIHQLLTLNVKFIFCVIPIFAGFSHIYYLKYFRHKKKVEFFILFFALAFTLYYFINYVHTRKFVVQKVYNLEKPIKTNRLGEGFKNLYWITPLHDIPADEINDLVEAVNIIKREQKLGKKKIVVTDYSFIFSTFSIAHTQINKFYAPGVSYPLTSHKSFTYYKDYFLKKLKKNKVEEVYFMKHNYYENESFFLKDIIIEDCSKKRNILNGNLIVYNIKNCY